MGSSYSAGATGLLTIAPDLTKFKNFDFYQSYPYEKYKPIFHPQAIMLNCDP